MNVNIGDVLNGLGVVGCLGLLFWMLATGRLCTGRELREKNQRIATLEAALDRRDAQISVLVNEVMPAVLPLMKALHRATGAEEEEMT